MLDQAGDYFHDTYGGEMVNLFGYLWAMKLTDFRTADERRKDGRAEHKTMTETSVILALHPDLVAQGARFSVETGDWKVSISCHTGVVDRSGFTTANASSSFVLPPLKRTKFRQLPEEEN